MATRTPTVVHPLIPVTPPPEPQTFRKPSLPLSSQLKRKASSDTQTSLDNAQQLPTPQPTSTPIPTPTLGTPRTPPATTTTSTQPKSAPQAQTQTRAQAQTPLPPGANPHLRTGGPNGPVQGPPLDPRYVSMVSRIAAYYQQRCQAISNAQQQRCQAWANMHRQKCQDTMQAAMLVVAWYIRDRIQRRRRKQKRKFRAGLRERGAARPRIAKGDSVRRWVMQVPDDAASAHILAARGAHDHHDTGRGQVRDHKHDLPSPRVADEDEAAFSMDREPPLPDKDGKLFEMADHLIRSQYRKVEVPMLGVLSFEESESESESEDEGEQQDDVEAPQRWAEAGEHQGFGQDGDGDDDEVEYEDYDDEVDDYDDDDMDEDAVEDDKELEASSSQMAQRGTGTGTGIGSGSGSNNRSLSS